MQHFQHRTHPGSMSGQQTIQPTPVNGPITLYPPEAVQEVHTNAVLASGGDIQPLGPTTRGLLFLDYRRAHELDGVLAEHPDITWVQLPYAGIDAFASIIKKYGELGVVFTSAKGAYSEPVAEHTLALILATKRDFVKRARAKTWGSSGGSSLYGENVVIVGAGGIANLLIDQIRPFRTKTTVVRRQPIPMEGAESTVPFAALDQVLPEADVVVLACAVTEETTYMINAERLKLMKPSAVLINVGRGKLVNSEDLADALEANTIYAAGIDVTDPEPLPEGHRLWELDNCLITPHTADTPQQVADLLSIRLATNVKAFLGEGKFQGIVDIVAGY